MPSMHQQMQPGPHGIDQNIGMALNRLSTHVMGWAHELVVCLFSSEQSLTLSDVTHFTGEPEIVAKLHMDQMKKISICCSKI